jgi:hypothetical protein
VRLVLAIAFAALTVVVQVQSAGAARACPAQRVGAGLPRLHTCCPRSPAADDTARLLSACCCSIDEPAPGLVAAPGRIAHRSDDRLAVVPSPVVVTAALVVRPIARLSVPPPRPSATPPRTLFEQRTLLLS